MQAVRKDTAQSFALEIIGDPLIHDNHIAGA